MARSTEEIKKSMTEAFMGNAHIRQAYGLKEDDSFTARFSSVSLESILFFIVASVAHALERIMDGFRQEIEEKIASAVVATVAWYYKQARAFQLGDELILDPLTSAYTYADIDESRQIVRYVAVQDRGGSLNILVSADKKGKPVPLSDTQLTAFRAYMNAIKVAGTVITVKSLPADSITIQATIVIDPMVITDKGASLKDGSRPVEQAIEGYLAGITYGGMFNKTQLVDAIQTAEGVLDVLLGTCRAKADGSTEWKTIETNNHVATAGCFTAVGLNTSIVYVV